METQPQHLEGQPCEECIATTRRLVLVSVVAGVVLGGAVAYLIFKK
jgi:hypothetical protein